jgi:hypothetical protein
MISQSQIEFMQAFGELSGVSRRDVTQGLKLAKYKKNALAMVKKDAVCGNTMLGLLACLEHDLDAMHACHKKAIELTESCFSLIYYAVSLEKSCLWSESARYALLALDYDPPNLKILEAIIKLTPLTGRFSLFKRLLPQWQELGSGEPHPWHGDFQIVTELLAKHGLLEKDLKLPIAAIGNTLSETNIILQDFRYDIVTLRHDAPFLHFRFAIPDEFAASYYEDLVAASLAAIDCPPRLFDAFSWSIENATVYRFYDCMDQELEASADNIVVPDPDRMKLIEELIAGVETRSW